ncbi:MAG TPA: hypothetical protein PJ991_07770 [Kiritimatiellia bacterium]|nr:hypothetical protein [Kiritimatiellia bacterium]
MTKGIIFRFALYTLIIFGFTGSLPFWVGEGDYLVFAENAFIQRLQLALLAASAIILVLVARSSGTPAVCYLLGIVTMIAFNRELDSFWNKIIPFLGWKAIVTLFVLAGIAVSYYYRHNLNSQIGKFLQDNGRSFGLFWCGFVVAVPFAQLVGHGDFLMEVLGDDYVPHYKRVIEELGELAGYMLLLVGSLELIPESNGKTSSVNEL